MTFDLQPTLSDDRVRLRPLETDDFEILYAVAKDPLIWVQHPASDRYKRDIFQDFFDGGLESGGAFLILDHKEKRVIGSTRFAKYNELASEIEIGWTFLARSHWGGPYNLAVKRLMLTHAFQFVNRVILNAGRDNHRSCKAIRKIGGAVIGERIDPDGSEHVRFAVTPERFERAFVSL